MAKTASTVEAAIIVLAAGLSSRMGGRSKTDLPLPDGRTMLQRQRDTVEQAGFHALVVGRSQSQAEVVNPHPERGLSESLRLGLQAARSRWNGLPVGIMLADQPFVTAADMGAVYQRFCQRDRHVHALRARYDGRPGHPLFFDPAWDGLILSLSGDQGLGALYRGRNDTEWVDIGFSGRPDPGFDVDTETAYQQALAWMQ